MPNLAIPTSQSNHPLIPAPSWRQIVVEIAAQHGVTTDQLIGPGGRTRKAAQARQHAMWALRELKGFTFPRIAIFLGCDHSTVIYGVDAHKRRMGS